MQFVLRTLARVQMMTRLSVEPLADNLIEEMGGSKAWETAGCLSNYLEEVSDAIQKKIGDACYERPGGDPNCLQCGQKVGRDHNGALYCSRRCRQKAYRVRQKHGHFLYRHFDKDGALLYVGVTNNLKVRLRTHRRSPWFADIAKTTTESFPSRKAAGKAEAKAILTEKPRYNRNVLLQPWPPRDASSAADAETNATPSGGSDTSKCGESETTVTEAWRA
jgi:hypothetical protein